jgi:hypothetical protein
MLRTVLRTGEEDEAEVRLPTDSSMEISRDSGTDMLQKARDRGVVLLLITICARQGICREVGALRNITTGKRNSAPYKQQLNINARQYPRVTGTLAVQ